MSFDKAFEVLLKHEGTTYTNIPADSGGPTKYGITLRELSRYRKTECTPDDVKNLGLEEAKDIYRVNYWKEMNLDQVRSEVIQTLLFDQGVLRGPQTATRFMQRALGFTGSDIDGQLGPKTWNAINNAPSDAKLGALFMCEIQDSYVDIVVHRPSQIIFLKGWINRTQELILACI